MRNLPGLLIDKLRNGERPPACYAIFCYTNIQLCERVPWLMVDDLGTERLSDWAAEVLFRVFNARYASRAPTFVVSNVCPDDIAEARLRSRFLDTALCQVVPNGAEDYRQRAPDFPNPCPDLDAAIRGNGKRAREFGV